MFPFVYGYCIITLRTFLSSENTCGKATLPQPLKIYQSGGNKHDKKGKVFIRTSK